MITSIAPTSISTPPQTDEAAQPSLDVYRGLAAVLVLILLVMVMVLIKQNLNRHKA